MKRNESTKRKSANRTMFWEFNQNNSGGSFVFDEKRGLTHYVIIEAKSRDEAISRAEDIGIYFNGCDDGRDCSCCGDRWYPPYQDAGDPEPTVYGKSFKTAKLSRWMKKGKEICVHYLNGKKEWA